MGLGIFSFSLSLSLEGDFPREGEALSVLLSANRHEIRLPALRFTLKKRPRVRLVPVPVLVLGRNCGERALQHENTPILRYCHKYEIQNGEPTIVFSLCVF